jgi:uncharacterized protein (TIGR03437 family)
MFCPNNRLTVAILLLSAARWASAQITINNPVFGTQGTAYSFQLQATGGTPPYTFSCQPQPNATSDAVPCDGLNTYGLTLSSSGLISGTPTTYGTATFSVQATDASNPPNVSGYLQKTIHIGQAPLVINTTSVAPATRGVSYNVPLVASGGSGGYSWTWQAPSPPIANTTNTLPAGLSVSTGAIAGTPSLSNPAGPYSFTIVVHDSASDVASQTLTMTVNNPAITLSGSPAAGILGGNYNSGVSASGGTGGPYMYTWIGNTPPGLSLNGSTGAITGIPTNTGTFNFTVSVSDSSSYTPTFTPQNYSITVYSAITISPTIIPAADALSNYAQTFAASGGSGPGYTYSISAVPTGMNFSGGTLSGAPSASGPYSFTITARDSLGFTGTSPPISLAVNPPLTLSPGTLSAGQVGTLYPQTTFAGSGGSGSYTYSSSGTVPGLTFSAGVLSGTPTQSGKFSFSVTVKDNLGYTSNNNYTLAISPPSLSITTTSLPPGNVNSSYSASLSAAGGTPPYTWSATPANALPAGLTLASNGNITGSPTNSGAFSFTATVTDASGATASASLSISIQGSTLSITTTSPLPPALSGRPYSVTFGATGGVSPYTFSVSSSDPQLTASGATLSGTPINATGSPVTYNVSVQVRDSVGDSAQGGFQLTVQPAAGGLILSAGSLAFTAVSGGPAPQPQYFSVSSTTTADVTFSAGADSPWLSVSPGGSSLSTPATLRISVNQTGLTASKTPYSGNINVNGPDGQHQVSVSLTVTAGPPQLSVTPTIVTFTTDGTSQPGAGSIQISNAGGGTVNFTVNVANGSSWVSLGSSPGSVTNASPVAIPVNALIAGLGTGVYRDVIEINSDSGSASVPVTLLVAGGSTISVEPAGSLFNSRQGQGESDGSQSFQIITTGTGTVNWTTSLNGGSGWLTLNTSSGFSGAGQPGSVSYTVNPSNLAAGNYYATVHINAPSATNSSIDFLVVATVAPDSSPAFPLPTPAGLLFISSPGSPVPPAQTIKVNTSNTAQITFSAAANTYSGGTWLTVSPSNGGTSTSAPGQVAATINAAGLATGVYQGGISFTLQGDPTAVRTVNVVLIVTGSAKSPSLITSLRPELSTDATCMPSKIVALQTGLVSNFSTPAGWPTPLAIQLDDDCGDPVPNASVVASFSNGDAPIALPLSDSKQAVYSATWNPHGTSNQVTVTARASAPNLQAATAQIVGAVSSNQVPILYQHGTIHNMNPQAGAPLAPGTIVQIYGSGLAPETTQTSLPLPTNVNGTIVLIGGIAAPLYYVSDGQINAQLPLQLTAGKQYQILISANGALTLPDTLDIEPVTPGVAATSSGQFIAQHANGSYVTAASPAQPGEILTIYLAGMGLTDGAITTGEVAPSTPLAHPLVQPVVTVNGESAQIAFAGLTPQAVGLYQINFTVPADTTAGNATLVVSQGTVQSNSGTLPVQ